MYRFVPGTVDVCTLWFLVVSVLKEAFAGEGAVGEGGQERSMHHPLMNHELGVPAHEK